MSISSLRVNDFRNLSCVQLMPCEQGINILSGMNGSGKTSLLEAIYYLGLGKSFRSANLSRLIRQSRDKFSIFAQIIGDFSRQIPVGVEWTCEGVSKVRISEQEAAARLEVTSLLPLRLINSQSHQLFESGPSHRRKFIDWGLFYQEEGFLNVWRQFERLLKQRNAVLKGRRSKAELDIWSNQLITQALTLDQYRRHYIENLLPIFTELVAELLDLPPIAMCYEPGWDETEDYAAILASDYSLAMRYGYTPYGPHRADLALTLGGVPVKHFLSRGQQKLLICAMILAQGILLTKQTNKGLIYLVDDLPAELDEASKQKLISLLSKQKTQVFMTAIESDTICHFMKDKLDVAMKVFHVEHGSIVGQMTE